MLINILRRFIVVSGVHCNVLSLECCRVSRFYRKPTSELKLYAVLAPRQMQYVYRHHVNFFSKNYICLALHGDVT